MHVLDEIIGNKATFLGALPAPVPAAPNGTRGRIVSLYALLIGFNAGTWIDGLFESRFVFLLGTFRHYLLPFELGHPNL